MHVTCSPNAKYTLLFSHGNAVDLGQMSSFFIGLGKMLELMKTSEICLDRLVIFKEETSKNFRDETESEYSFLRLLRLRTEFGKTKRVEFEQSLCRCLRETAGEIQCPTGPSHSLWTVNRDRFVRI